jgi:hypothetical protein
MIQEVQTYQDAVAAADEEYSQAAANRDAAHADAWTELGQAENAFVAWAVAQVNEHEQYKNETLAILAALAENPTAQDVRNAARESGYDTAVLTQAIAQAVAAGTLSEGDETMATDGNTEAPRRQGGERRRRFLDQVRSQFDRHTADDVSRTIDEIIAEETAN